MTTAAKIISILFHPLFMVTWLFTVFALYFPPGLDPLNSEVYFDFIIRITGVTFLMPALIIGLFKLTGSVKSVTMVNRKERITPFFFMAVIYTGIIFMLASQQRISIHDNLLKFLIITDALVLVSFFVTLFYKVSIHSLAIWGVVGILLPLNKVVEDGSLFYPLIASLILAGIVMSARLKLSVHSPREVWLGAVLGMVTSYVGMLVLFF